MSVSSFFSASGDEMYSRTETDSRCMCIIMRIYLGLLVRNQLIFLLFAFFVVWQFAGLPIGLIFPLFFLPVRDWGAGKTKIGTEIS